MSTEADVEAVLQKLSAWAVGTRRKAMNAAQEIAQLLEDYAREEHAWQDETGDTRASTRGEVIEAAEEIAVRLSAGMPYDKFLELAHDGKWAWLWPAMIANEDRIMEILKRHLQGGTVESF